MQLLSLRVKTIVNFIRSPWRKPILKSRRDFKQQLQLSQRVIELLNKELTKFRVVSKATLLNPL
jgi:hypothetical protein